MLFQDQVRRTVAFIQEKWGNAQPAPIGIVLGTGLGSTADFLQECEEVEYSKLPGFPCSSVQSHASKLLRGLAGNRTILALSGRPHLYEGFSAREACFGIRVLGELGVRTLVLTNAAGALNPRYETGSLMLLSDHINLTGQSPLTGQNNEDWGDRFPDMSRTYSAKLRELALELALKMGIRMEHGVYAQVCGPQLETPAETRMIRMLGADAVGMSTALEAICARHMGMDVLAFSCLTNKNLPDCMAETTHAEVVDVASKATGNLARLLTAILPIMEQPA